MGLDELKRNWDELGRADAMWAVLTRPDRGNRSWDSAEFFATGEGDVGLVFDRLAAHGIAPRTATALDFGCGIGRLTQALAKRFDHVVGVDIAPSMIERAERWNRHGERCRYVLNDAPDLTQFGDASFDFVLSTIVLQHIEPPLASGYISEIVRVLAPGGVAVFQVPHAPVGVDAETASPSSSSAEHATPATLAPESCRARIELIDAPGRIAPAASAVLSIRVTNIGAQSWPARGGANGGGAVHLGNHWLDVRGRTLKQDDVRVELARDLEPGDEVTTEMSIEAPVHPGTYVLELDMVQELVAWFAGHGSQTTRHRIVVGGLGARVAAACSRIVELPRRLIGRAPTQAILPRMEMHCVARDQVEALVVAAGGGVAAVDEDDAPGSAFVSYRYYVVR